MTQCDKQGTHIYGVHEQCRSHHTSNKFLVNFVVLQGKNGRDTDFTAKIVRGFERDGIRYDLAMMQLLKQSTSNKYTIPTGYGIVEDDGNNYPRWNALTPVTHWYPEGEIFEFDNNGGRQGRNKEA